METKNEHGLKDRKQAASYLGVSVVTVDRKVKNKELSCYYIGRRKVFSLAQLDKFLSNCEQKAKRG